MTPRAAADKLRKNLKSVKTYGLSPVLRTHLQTILFKLSGNKPESVQGMHEAMAKKLTPVFEAAARDLPDAPEPGEKIARDAPIWILWWQGPEHYPELVRRMVQNIRANRGEHPVIELSRENLDKYIQFPEHIRAKVEAGTISITSFSDIVRMGLIYQYGGIWMDATMLTTAPLPEQMYELSFFSIRRSANLHPYVSRSRWTSYFMAGGKGCPVLKFAYDFLVEYWRTHDRLLDYVIVDYALRLGDDRLPWMHEIIEAVPCSNDHVRELAERMNEPFDSAGFARMTADTTLFKLSWKDPYRTESGGKPTYWAHILKNLNNTD